MQNIQSSIFNSGLSGLGLYLSNFKSIDNLQQGDLTINHLKRRMI